MSPTVVVAMFGAGVLSFVNPCVLPLVPVWSAVALGAAPERPGLVVRSTLPFVAGLAAVFAGLGAAAGSFGDVVDAAGAWVPRVGGVVLVGFGLVHLGVGPEVLRRERRLSIRLPARSTRPGAAAVRGLVAGVAAGAAWTPCVGPLLGAALVAASTSGGAVRGAGLLAVYAAGVGVPFVVAALALDAWPRRSAVLARRGAGLRRAGGVLMVLAGIALASGTSARLVQPLAELVSQ